MNNAISIGGSSSQLARMLASVAQVVNIPQGSAAVLIAYKLRELASRFLVDTRELYLALKAWIRANPRQLAAICIGITLLVLACSTPAILGAIGFSATGPVLGSIAAGWQASIGSVVVGSLFAFLQSAAMGGAALLLFTGIGALGAMVALFGVGASMDVPRELSFEVIEPVGEKFVRAGEVMKYGAIQFGGAIAVGIVRVGKTVGGWFEKLKGKMKRE